MSPGSQRQALFLSAFCKMKYLYLKKKKKVASSSIEPKLGDQADLGFSSAAPTQLALKVV